MGSEVAEHPTEKTSQLSTCRWFKFAFFEIIGHIQKSLFHDQVAYVTKGLTLRAKTKAKDS